MCAQPTRRSRQSRAFRWAMTGGVGLVGVMVALAVVETALRLAGFSDRLCVRTALTPPWTWVGYDPITIRSNVPGFEATDPPLRIGRLGFRGEDPILPKPRATVRIACLGDSTTFGVFREGPFSISTRSSYPDELARLAAARGLPQVDVVNAGVLGYTSAEGLVTLITRVLPVNPDIVTLRFGNNDRAKAWPGESSVATDGEYATLRALPPSLWRSEVGRLAFFVYRQYGPKRAAGVPKVPLDRFDVNLRRLIETARAHGANVLFLDFPLRLTPGAGKQQWPSGSPSFPNLRAAHQRYQDVVERVATETGTPVVRTADALGQSPDPAFTDWDLSHPNTVGQRIIAERMLEEMVARGWLGPRTRAEVHPREAPMSTARGDALGTSW